MSQITRGVTDIQDTRQLRRRLRLGELLVSEGLTSEAEIHVALSQQKQQKGKRLGEVLVELGMVDESAIAMVLATFRLVDGVMVEPRIGVGGAEEVPRRLADAEAVLAGRAPETAAFQEAAEAAAEAVDPMTDINTSAQYRRDLVRALTRRALERAAA